MATTDSPDLGVATPTWLWPLATTHGDENWMVTDRSRLLYTVSPLKLASTHKTRYTRAVRNLTIIPVVNKTVTYIRVQGSFALDSTRCT